MAVALRAAPAAADDVLKMSVSIPLTGAGLNAVGLQLAGARSSFTLRNVGRRIGLTVCDDGSVADNARPIMQDMIVNRKVGGIAPTSLAIAPLVTEAKIQLNCLGHRHQVAHMVRAGFLQSQQAWIMAEWAARTAASAW